MSENLSLQRLCEIYGWSLFTLFVGSTAGFRESRGVFYSAHQGFVRWHYRPPVCVAFPSPSHMIWAHLYWVCV